MIFYKEIGKNFLMLQKYTLDPGSWKFVMAKIKATQQKTKI